MSDDGSVDSDTSTVERPRLTPSLPMSTTNLVDDDVDSDAGSSSSRSFLTDSDDNVASSSEEETTLRTTGSQLRGVAADLNLDSDSEDEDEPYEQQPDAEDRRWKSALAARTRALENRLAEERNLQDRRPQEPDTIGPRGTRAQIKVACGLLRVRQMLLNSDWAVVASGLQVIAAEVPRAEAFQRPSASTEPAQAKNSFGVYTPILARLACDVHDALEREGSSREARRTEMTKGSAKALVALRQRWLAIMAPGSSSLTSTRGGGKDSKEREWVGTVRRLVAQVSKALISAAESARELISPLGAPAESPARVPWRPCFRRPGRPSPHRDRAARPSLCTPAFLTRGHRPRRRQARRVAVDPSNTRDHAVVLIVCDTFG